MKEHCTADLAEEHGLHEADHCASRRAGRGHTVLCVLSLPSFPDRRLRLVGVNEAREEAVQRVGDGFVEALFEGLQEQNRLNIMDAQRSFVEVDNPEAEKIGDLEKNSEAIEVVGQLRKRKCSQTRRSGKWWTD